VTQTFGNDMQANALISRPRYRPPYIVPDKV